MKNSDKCEKIQSSNAGKYLTRREVAELLRVCPHTIQRLTRKGELPAVVFNQRLIRYEASVVEQFIKNAKAD